MTDRRLAATLSLRTPGAVFYRGGADAEKNRVRAKGKDGFNNPKIREEKTQKPERRTFSLSH